ncbi:MAG: virulence RhuM family protein [Paludibacteraceae bacterium]|nr:virulence RhuM family protein [Paludibacteraceae bacterium]
MNEEMSISKPQKESVVVYQSKDGTLSLEVQIADETVWLTQQQMSVLFNVKENNITYHIQGIYKTHELEPEATTQKIRVVRLEGNRSVARLIDYYNLDMIISVGYRVNSPNATQFRRWATGVLKEYLLRGYAVNQRIERLEQRVAKTEEQIDFFVRTSLPSVEHGFERTQYNQTANYAYLDTPVNISIGKKAPKDYFSAALAQCGTGKAETGSIVDEKMLRENLATNCIPEDIFEMDYTRYDEFLEKRRTLMAQKIKKYYESL